MKKIGKLKLNQLSKAELEKREMNSLKGGSACVCTCYNPNGGYADTNSISSANYGWEHTCNTCVSTGGYGGSTSAQNKGIVS